MVLRWNDNFKWMFIFIISGFIKQEKDWYPGHLQLLTVMQTSKIIIRCNDTHISCVIPLPNLPWPVWKANDVAKNVKVCNGCNFDLIGRVYIYFAYLSCLMCSRCKSSFNWHMLVFHFILARAWHLYWLPWKIQNCSF